MRTTLETGKPAFKWIGLPGFYKFIAKINSETKASSGKHTPTKARKAFQSHNSAFRTPNSERFCKTIKKKDKFTNVMKRMFSTLSDKTKDDQKIPLLFQKSFPLKPK